MYNGNGMRVFFASGYLCIEDKGEREIPPPLCSRRLDNGGWCALADGHDGACEGPARRFGPEQSIWHRHRGRQTVCGNVTGPSTVCLMPRGHSGSCK